MNLLNNKNRLDESSGIGQENSNEAMQPASQSKKTPWHLRFAPGAILRKKGIIAIIAVVALLTPISAMALHPVVVFLLGWGAGQTLTESKELLKSKFLKGELKKATASVNGAYWSRNYYRYSLTGDGAVDLTAPYSYRRIIARQGHELTGTASGTRDGVAMEEEEAENYLQTQGRYTVVSASGWAENDDEDTILVMWMIAREDYFSKLKDKTLATLRELYDDPSYEWKDDLWIKHTTRRSVGNHRMVSDFNDPNEPKVAKLGDPGPPETEHYIGTAEWDIRLVERSGRRSSSTVMWTEVEFDSFRDQRRSIRLCEENQVIENPHISASIARQIENRPVMKRVRKHTWIGVSYWSYTVASNRLYVVHVAGDDLYSRRD